MGVLRISHNKTLAEFNPFVSSAWENMHKTSSRIDKDVTAIKISQQGFTCRGGGDGRGGGVGVARGGSR